MSNGAIWKLREILALLCNRVSLKVVTILIKFSQGTHLGARPLINKKLCFRLVVDV
jgi:hypothetical protein